MAATPTIRCRTAAASPPVAPRSPGPGARAPGTGAEPGNAIPGPPLWRGWHAALRFVALQHRGVIPAGVHDWSRQLSLPERVLETDVYEPSGVAPAASLLLVHGMSAHAHRDLRMVAFARMLAACGLRVVVPCFPEIRDTRISAASIDDVEQAALAVADDATLVPRGRLGLAAPSFSGAMILLATARPRLARRVDALLSIGAFGHVDSVLARLMGDETSDPYGRLVILRNFVEHATGPRPAVVRALELAILDGFHGDDPPRLPAFEAGMAPADRDLLRGLLDDVAFRRAQVPAVLDAIPELVEQLDVARHSGGIRAPVLLLHGRDDPVIPARESEDLAAVLRRHGVPHRLVVTPFLSHGDARLRLRLLADLARLLDGLRFFFGALTA